MILNTVNFYTGQIIGDYIYASQAFFNGLIRINLKTEKAEYITKFPEESVVPVLHRFSYLYKNKIFFIPCDAKNLAIYDVDNNSISVIPISQYCKNGDTKSCYFVDDSKLWLIPVSGDGHILIVNMDNNEMEVRDIKTTPFYRRTLLNICQRDKRLYFAGYGTNQVVEYDVKNGTAVKITTTISGISFVSKCRDGVCVINQDGEIAYLTSEDKELDYRINDFERGEQFVNILDYRDGYYLVPYKLGAFLKRGIDDECPEKYDISDLGLEKYYGYPGAFSYDLIEADDKWYLPPYNTNKIVTIDKENGTIEAITLSFDMPVKVNEADLRKTLIENVCSEWMPIDLKSFIEII